eukprot:14139056-Alexandrium_andersonii.AAC.1
MSASLVGSEMCIRDSQGALSDDETADEYEPLATPPWDSWDREASAWRPTQPCASAPAEPLSASGRTPVPRSDKAPAVPCVREPA